MAAQMASVSTMMISSTYCLREAEGFLADQAHGRAVGKQADVGQGDALAGLERARHGVRIDAFARR